MTRRTNARIAGVTFLAYIAAGVTSLVLFRSASRGDSTAARLASIAQHSTEMSIVVLLALATSFAAVVLGVTLYALTRDEDRDLAMLGMVCRVLEGVAHLSVARALGLAWLGGTGASGGLDSSASDVLGAFLFRMGAWGPDAIYFAVGSALFALLFLRGRLIPIPLAWLGIVASALLILVLPLQLSGLGLGPLDWLAPGSWLVWLPMLVFELVLAFWLIAKGVRPARVAA